MEPPVDLPMSQCRETTICSQTAAGRFYLHRGGVEEAEFDALLYTPLRHMSYYDYGMYVKVVAGDPANLLPNQYPFATHHAKYHDYVQELRQHLVIPYISGFTMQTKERDAECLFQTGSLATSPLPRPSALQEGGIHGVLLRALLRWLPERRRLFLRAAMAKILRRATLPCAGSRRVGAGQGRLRWQDPRRLPEIADLERHHSPEAVVA